MTPHPSSPNAALAELRASLEALEDAFAEYQRQNRPPSQEANHAGPLISQELGPPDRVRGKRTGSVRHPDANPKAQGVVPTPSQATPTRDDLRTSRRLHTWFKGLESVWNRLAGRGSNGR